MSDRYAPDLDTLPNGVVVESYGRAHAARQADALALLDEIAWADSAVALVVWCSCRLTKNRSRLARVYRTTPAVITIAPETHTDADIRRIQSQVAPVPVKRDTRIHYGTDIFADILHAPGDRELEARCRNCGRHELDRDAIIDAYAKGERELRVGP